LRGKAWLRLGVVAGGMFAACNFAHGVFPPDGPPNMPPDAVPCTSLANECVGDTLRYCMEVGGSATEVPCGWGCIAGADAHCAHVVPTGSGGSATDGVMPSDVDGVNLAALGDITLPDGITFNADDGRIGTGGNTTLYHNGMQGIDKGIDFQFRGPIAMWRFKKLTFNGTITLIGARPIALVSDGPVTINGAVNASGVCSGNVAGPGGFNGGGVASQDGFAPAGSMGFGEGAANTSGGGGGGYGSTGGSGDAALGGKVWGDAEIMKLVGGAGGGAGGGGGMFGRGGGGGGALQIVTNTGVVITMGGINAGGCGGKPGLGNGDSGGGGGAGGTILIEAPTVMINGALAVNGGGGGGGGGAGAKAGGSGSLDRMPAAGGDPDGTDEEGGAGAVGGMAAQPGGTGSNPGGGGGGVGRIRINTRAGKPVDLMNALLSPSPDDPATTFSIGPAKTL
jgi:hypothetical protein